ncbi:MAG: FG-GAP-like repeat-containing protein [Syntrophaceae bacterium]
MKKTILIALGMVLLMATFSSPEAQQTKKIAILPFTVNSSENINYIRDGIWDMLISRVTVSGKTDVLSKSSVLEAMGTKKDITQADVLAVGKRLKADFVVWGSITKIGESLSLDGKLLDVASSQSPVTLYEQTRGMNEVIPKIGDFSQRIRSHVTGEALAAPTAPVAPAAAAPTAASAATASAAAGAGAAAAGKSQETDIVAGMRKGKTTYTGIINPDYITAPEPLGKKGFWMSPKYGTEFKGVDIGDVNGDGLNETVIIDNTNVYIYQRDASGFKLLKKITGGTYEQYLGVDIADVNGNGTPEIFVTSINRQTIDSFVLEYRNGNYEVIAKGLNFMMRALNTMGTTRLLGQVLSTSPQNPFINPIHHVTWDDGKYRLGEKLQIPQGLPVYGLTMDAVDGLGVERVLTFDENDYLRIYEKTSKLLIHLQKVTGAPELIWRSDDVYGGSNSTFKPVYAAGTRSMVDEPDAIYMKPRILTYDLNKDGKKEVIVVKNLSAMGRVLKNMPLFTSAEVYNLEWDGLGLAEVWRTKKINGYVADYQIKDIDNDGQDEIVLALVLSVGPTIKSNSCLVAYKLTPQAQ